MIRRRARRIHQTPNRTAHANAVKLRSKRGAVIRKAQSHRRTTSELRIICILLFTFMFGSSYVRDIFDTFGGGHGAGARGRYGAAVEQHFSLASVRWTRAATGSHSPTARPPHGLRGDNGRGAGEQSASPGTGDRTGLESGAKRCCRRCGVRRSGALVRHGLARGSRQGGSGSTEPPAVPRHSGGATQLRWPGGSPSWRISAFA
jgi:hypothetical protein